MNHEEACLALFAAADDGDRKAQELVQEVGRYVGYGCVTIFNMFNPRRIVIGDIVSQAGPRLLRAVRDVVNERAIPELNDATAISPWSTSMWMATLGPKPAHRPVPRLRKHGAG